MQRGFSTLVIILSLVLLGGLIGGAFYLGKINYSSQSVVNNFEDCPKAGYPVMESYQLSAGLLMVRFLSNNFLKKKNQS